jgi:hypothetical protein
LLALFFFFAIFSNANGGYHTVTAAKFPGKGDLLSWDFVTIKLVQGLFSGAQTVTHAHIIADEGWRGELRGEI